MSGDPWADPSTPTEPGAPYAGPPPGERYRPPGSVSPYGPPVYGGPPYGGWPYGGTPYGGPPYGDSPYGGYPPPGYPPPGHGYPAWLPPRPPQKPGGVIGAAVLAFVQAAIVVIASIYVWFFASLADVALTGLDTSYTPSTIDALATEGTALAIVQLLSAALLVGAGVRALNARTEGARRLLLGAHAVQVVLALYWVVRLSLLFDDGGAVPLLAFAAVFAAGPLVSIGLLLTAVSRVWFAARPRPGSVPGPWPGPDS